MLEEPLLEIQDLTKQFGGLIAVDGVGFTVRSREIFGLIGPNGAGKTTLFNMLTGLIEPTQGKVIYERRNIAQLKPYQIAQCGIARTFQNLRLFGNLSVLENVEIACHRHNSTSLLADILNFASARKARQQDRESAQILLELVGLTSLKNQLANNLAYGDRRRLEIARALALKPSLLLLDEPAAGMNPNEKAALSELIREIRDRFHLTIILIEHHIPLVMGLCDRIAVLDFGKLIALGNPETVRQNPAVIEAYLGDE
ncbi:MAG: ABC transporter ATP-binding protein [Jaaginema sp. PMC 1080.18]|nr:ABC transporter ATP-binding protein [Jaaginema sp. PMC 1080.18]MEC4867406.1 ABC transporter ATP-binding protein [Jaaginema sp. PMC 1078.18]